MPVKRRLNLVYFFDGNVVGLQNLVLFFVVHELALRKKLSGKCFIIGQFYKLFFSVAKHRSTSLVWLYIFFTLFYTSQMNFESVEKAVVLIQCFKAYLLSMIKLQVAAFNCFAYIVFIFCIKSQL